MRSPKTSRIESFTASRADPVGVAVARERGGSEEKAVEGVEASVDVVLDEVLKKLSQIWDFEEPSRSLAIPRYPDHRGEILDLVQGLLVRFQESPYTLLGFLDSSCSGVVTSGLASEGSWLEGCVT